MMDDSEMGPLTDCRNRRDDLAELELVQNRRFARRVEPDHENAHFLLAEEALEETGEHVAHFDGADTRLSDDGCEMRAENGEN